MDDKTSVDVIVPVYGNWELTARCLRSLQAQTQPHRVIVVDDASPDNTVEQLARAFPSVHLVQMEHNSGFGRACNAGIRQGDGIVVVVLNNDVEAHPTLLERLVETFTAQQGIGSAAPLILRPDGRVDAYGIWADVTLEGWPRFQGASPDADLESGPALLGPYGAVAAYRRKALDTVGLFDENIRMYGEELELAMRLQVGGWKCATVRAATAVHLGSATAGAKSARQRLNVHFGRGYILRVYDVMHTRYGWRTAVSESVVVGWKCLRYRDLLAARGLLEGWKAGSKVPKRMRPTRAIDRRTTLLRTIMLRARN